MDARTDRVDKRTVDRPTDGHTDKRTILRHVSDISLGLPYWLKASRELLGSAAAAAAAGVACIWRFMVRHCLFGNVVNFNPPVWYLPQSAVMPPNANNMHILCNGVIWSQIH